ncbi:MAG TPA: DUF1036 domain-containing protein [Thermoanaerobaculia bacterium]
MRTRAHVRAPDETGGASPREGYEKGGNRQYDRILLRSTCDVPVDVALYYLDLDQSWITRGWWSIKPGDTVTTNAMTRNSPIYVYAENQAVGRRWDGEGKEDSLSRRTDEGSLSARVRSRFHRCLRDPACRRRRLGLRLQ